MRAETAAGVSPVISIRKAETGDAHRFYRREGYQATGLRFQKDLQPPMPLPASD
jgi:hypothetical protein